VSVPGIRLNTFSKKTDEEIQEELMTVKGIGPWTAEMFLIFAMARPDVFSLHDGALKSVIGELHKVDADKQDNLIRISERWRPYRSVACWYLYKHKNDT
jgi:DNA-3-methyladenine glycosylase II